MGSVHSVPFENLKGHHHAQINRLRCQPNDVDKQLKMLQVNGFCLIENAYSHMFCDEYAGFLERVAPLLKCKSNDRGAGSRWSLSGDKLWDHDASLEMISQERLLQLMQRSFADKWGRYCIVNLGGDYVEQDCLEDQPLHSDDCSPTNLRYAWDYGAGKF